MQKIINIKNCFNFTEIKLFGIQVWKKFHKKGDRHIVYVILNGLFVYIYDTRNNVFNLKFLNTIFFNLNILKTRLVGSYKIWYLFFIPIFAKNIVKNFYTDFLDEVIKKEPDYDDYYIFISASGEFFLLMHHFAEIIKRNKSENYLPVFTQKYHSMIFKMFYPDIKSITITDVIGPLVARYPEKAENNYKGKRIFFPLYEKYFVKLEKEIRNNGVHYYDYLKKFNNLGNNLTNYKILPEIDEFASGLSKKLFNDKFVIISTDSGSNEKLPNSFWNKLAEKLKENGYEVFCNVMNSAKKVSDTITIFIDYREAAALSKYARGIVGLRSGFLECQSQNNVPLIALYTNFTKRGVLKSMPSDMVMKSFSIKKLPNVNKEKIFEYDMNTYDNIEDLIPVIVEIIKNNK